MKKRIKDIYYELNFNLKSRPLSSLLGDSDVELGEYGKCTIEQFLTIYNIYNKADEGLYSEKTADTLCSLYGMLVGLLIDMTQNPRDEEKCNQFLAIANILNIYGVRTNIELNATMRRYLKKGTKNLPSEERLHQLVKKIFPQGIPERKAQ